MNKMVIPEWVDEIKEDAFNALADFPKEVSTDPVRFTVIEGYNRHFPEYALINGDLVLHFFPKSESSEKWYPTTYKDGEYIPSRGEERKASFYDGAEEHLKRAIDKNWMGDVLFGYVSELGAYCVKIEKGEKSIPGDLRNFVESICSDFDLLLG